MRTIGPPRTRPTADPPAGGTPRGRRAWPLIALELLIAASALFGGVGLIWNDAIRMPDDWLQDTPFATWLLPGILLLLIIAVPMITSATLALRRSPWSTIGAVAAGSAQIGWIAAELLIMQRYNVLQPVMMLCGLAVILLALWVRRNLSVVPNPQGGAPD